MDEQRKKITSLLGVGNFHASTSHLFSTLPRRARAPNSSVLVRAPPAPSVEDVSDDGEDVPNRGEVDQWAVLIPCSDDIVGPAHDGSDPAPPSVDILSPQTQNQQLAKAERTTDSPRNREHSRDRSEGRHEAQGSRRDSSTWDRDGYSQSPRRVRENSDVFSASSGMAGFMFPSGLTPPTSNESIRSSAMQDSGYHSWRESVNAGSWRSLRGTRTKRSPQSGEEPYGHQKYARGGVASTVSRSPRYASGLMPELITVAASPDLRSLGPTLLRRALDTGDDAQVASLLEHRFVEVSQDEFVWLRDLMDVDVGIPEMVEVLFGSNNSVECAVSAEEYPGLEPEALKRSLPELDDSFHQKACAHMYRLHREDALKFDPVSVSSNRSLMQQRVAALCGLGGVIVHSNQEPGKSSRKGVTITESTAHISFLGATQDSNKAVALQRTESSSLGDYVAELKSSASNLKAAASAIQQSGFCCNEFSILIEKSRHARTVQLRRIHFRQLDFLDRAIRSLEAAEQFEPLKVDIRYLTTGIKEVDRLLSDEDQSWFMSASIYGQVHICSLALQVLSIGLLLHSQAHTGELRPFFLTGPLERIYLHGVFSNPAYGDSIVVERRQLACLGDMIGDSVFVFRNASDKECYLPRQHPGNEKLYVLGSCSQITDLWGPGYMIGNFKPTSDWAAAGISLTGFYIRGGFIQRDISTGQPNTFHWAREWNNNPAALKTFGYRDELTIGTVTECQPVSSDQGPVEKNDISGVLNLPTHSAKSSKASTAASKPRPPVFRNPNCPLDLTRCRQESEPYLSILGTSPDWWSLTEVQAMAAVNPGYFTIQGAFSMTKQSGIPLKRVLLDRWAGDENLTLFDEPWGLQVSPCTGVARRVPLRSVIEEPLIRFVDSLDIPGWDSLKARAVQAFQAPADAGLSRWAATLDTAQRQCMRAVLSRLLHVLKDTGFDKSGKQFSILWPHGTDARFCVRILPEKHKNQLWCSMLQDTEWCATFAVVSSQCLETDTIACRNIPITPWRGGAKLSTVVCPNFTGAIPRPVSMSSNSPSQAGSSMQRWQLQDKKQYWIGKQGSQIWVVVRRYRGEVTELQIKKNRFPASVSAFLWPDKVLREKPDVSFCGEDVFVSQ
ncbi:hypothetical protein QBC34DRAFT_417972 [Podospora aff. communis PSN243]|uniref:Uncharacterized protein n=1 Tax=Podospora aff. communis PSN243 TaxID=3040156 RepID=A0AAV9G497_9PEZI|nr:hypothetical protein QBC34DRAFT_417972 [Podospora aff. communis PSN243]